MRKADPSDVEAMTFRPYESGTRSAEMRAAEPPGEAHAYLLEVRGDAMSRALEALMPSLGNLLREKTVAARARKLEALVEFVTSQLVVPGAVEVRMAQRLAARHARLLSEFGYATADQLADTNHSQASNRQALADNWKRRGMVLALPHRDGSGKSREVFPLFQFENHQPIKAMRDVLRAFGPTRSPWKVALWFASNNGRLPGQARPADRIASDGKLVLQAALRDAAAGAA
jgi:hypothetical protein